MIKKRPAFSATPEQTSKPRKRWNIFSMIWGAVKRTCMILGAMVLISMGFTLYTLINYAPAQPLPLPEKMVLFIEFDEPLVETHRSAGFAAFGGLGPTLRQVVNTLDKAAADPRVQGVVVRFEGAGFAPAHVQELRAAVKNFRASGKFAYAYSPSFFELGGGFPGYYLASAFEEIWMQPMGSLFIAGLNLEMPYLKGVLDKVGVQPAFFQRKDYKTVFENITQPEMSPENRETLERLLGDIRSEMVADIAADRGLPPAQVQALVDQGLFTAQEAAEAKLISHADYADVLIGNIKEELQGDRDSEDLLFIPMSQYRNHPSHFTPKMLAAKKPKQDKVALIYINGPIMYSNPDLNASVAAADEIAPAILDAGYDDAVKAIVLRVDSPGGSPLASETILRAVERAQARGKKVIVSMGPTAASGGYWVSAYADRIFALPTTITGSIGVAGGKFVLQELWTKIGVNWQGVQWGENADILSFNEPFTPQGEARFNAMLDDTYDAFITRVAKGRKMTPEAVDRIAGGRVWSGKRAVEVGLVDELGGLDDALNYTAKELGLESAKDMSLVVLPQPKNFVDQVLELLGARGLVFETLRMNGALAKILGPLSSDIQVMSSAPLSAYEPVRLR